MSVDVGEWEDWDFPPPPPPPPPTSVCSAGGSDLYCHLVDGGAVGARFNGAVFPTLPIVAVCSSVVLVALLVAAFLIWRHKSKVPNLLACKNEQQGHMGEMGAANGVPYEDILINHHPTRLPQSGSLMPLEILDIKLGDPIPPMHQAPCYRSRDQNRTLPFHPVYEEVSQASIDKSSDKLTGGLTSDDDFPISGEGSGQCSATSSVRGSTGGDLCRYPVSSDEDLVNGMVPSGDNRFPYSRQIPCDRMRNTVQCSPYPLTDRTMNHIPHSTDGTKRPLPINHNWRTRQPEHFPTSASQENIYSTIDEDDLVDYPVQPPLPSLACPSNKLASVMSQNKHLLSPSLSQRQEPGSYGDMMPAYHQTSAYM